MKSLKHTLQKTTDENGEMDLFTPLREHASEPAVKRVENVLRLLVEADTLAREQRAEIRSCERAGKAPQRNESFMESLRASNRTCELLNAELMRYHKRSVSFSRPGNFRIVDALKTDSKGQWAPWECWAVGTLVSLAKKPGELARLRRCVECQQWFRAIRGHQQFCGISCRRHHAAQDPEFKEKRATYMREVYRAVIVPEAEKRQAGRVPSDKSTKGGK